MDLSVNCSILITIMDLLLSLLYSHLFPCGCCRGVVFFNFTIKHFLKIRICNGECVFVCLCVCICVKKSKL